MDDTFVPWLVLKRPSVAGFEAPHDTGRRYPNLAGAETIRDAFRHAYWSALLSKRAGTSWSERFTTAHESESTNVLASQMDLNNNLVGRKVWRANRYSFLLFDSGLADKIDEYPRKKIRHQTEISSSFLVYTAD